MKSLKKIIKFIELTSKRKKSEEDYFKFQSFQARLMIKDLVKIFKIDENTKILEIGSGIGGYLSELAKIGCKVKSLDLNPLEYTLKKFENIENVSIIEGDITNAPFQDAEFDLIIASGVIEHVPNQKKMIQECKRILKKEGIFYLSFPPYYSPKGGHSISPFHYLPKKIAFKLYKTFYQGKHKNFKYYGLVKTTIKSAKNLIKNDFKIIKIKARIFDFLNPIAKIPLLNEILIHHVELILQKK